MLRHFLLTAAIAAASSAVAFGAGAVYVDEHGPVISLGNDYLERTIRTDGGLRTVNLRNKLSGSIYTLSGDEFELSLIFERVGYSAGGENPWIVTSRDLGITDHKVSDLSGGGKQVVFHLATAPRSGRPLEIELTYELKPEDFFIRQWIRLAHPQRGTYFVDRVSVAKNRWGDTRFALGGYGQPLFGPDVFLGIEYPTGHNLESAGEAALWYRPGMNIPVEGLLCEAAVIGVAQTGALSKAFQEYVRRIRAAAVRPYILYNSWYDIQRRDLNQENVSARIPVLNQVLLSKYGIHLDSFVLDDGWDDMQHTWAIDSQRFPNGFRDIVGALQGIGSGLGLWFGPIGGYSQRNVRIAAGKRAGLEVTSNGQYFCIAGRNYGKLLTDTMVRYEKEYNVNYFKLDGMPFGCNEPDHGHPTGIYSDDAEARAFIGMLQALRAQDPNVFLNITTSIWLSPWWLRYADTVFMGGADSGYLSGVPALAPRQSAISYRDSVIFNDFSVNHDQFPISSIMTHGIIKGRRNMLGGRSELIDDWIDEVVHYASVGNMMVELYISPDALSPEELASLAAVLHWSKANAHPLLDNSTLTLGDPAKREPYAYVHDSAAKTIVTLRNPFVDPQTVRMKVDRANGFDEFSGARTLEFVYPYRSVRPGEVHYGDSLSFELGAYEQRVFELKPRAKDSIEIQGIRFAAEASSGTTAALRVYAPAGSTRTFRLAAPGLQSIRADGAPAVVSAAGEVKVQFGGGSSELSYSQPSLVVSGGAEGRTLRAGESVQVPPDYREARLAFLLEPEHEIRGVTAEARDGGKPVEAAIENGGRGVWHWISMDLAPGSHQIDLTLHVPTSPGELKLSAWLLSKRQLAVKELRLDFQPGAPVPGLVSNLLPDSTPIERQTALLLRTVIP